MERTASDEALLALARMAMDASVRAADDLGGLSPVQLRALTALGQAWLGQPGPPGRQHGRHRLDR